MSSLQTVPARSGVATRVAKDETIKVINTHGSQVIDFWAFAAPLPQTGAHVCPTYLSLPHSRAATMHLSPLVDDVLVTNQRSPILQLIEDTSGGVHDTLIPACDRHRYAALGAPGHANCSDNLRAALSAFSDPFVPDESWPTPSPLNLFMNIPVHLPSKALAANNVTAGGVLSFETPVCEKGAYVVFKALCDCVVVMSACPQDLVPVNGAAMQPTEAHFVVQA